MTQLLNIYIARKIILIVGLVEEDHLDLFVFHLNYLDKESVYDHIAKVFLYDL